MAKLTPLHREVVRGMPQLPEQEVRVLFATLLPATSRLTTPIAPGHRVRHRGHVPRGAGRAGAIAIGAGQAFVEPAASR
jgi:hypothetical protein